MVISRATMRNRPCTGDSSRSTSSLNCPARSGASRSMSNSSGFSISHCMPAAIALVVVSLPATSSCEVSDSISGSEKPLPASSFTFATCESRSSRGAAMRACSSAVKNAWNSACSFVQATSRSSLTIMPSGSTEASDHSLIFGARLRGTPSWSAITLIGTGIA